LSISDPERAGRLARVLASDLVAEWGDEMRTGLEKDDFFTRLGPQIERARIFYLARVAPEVEDRRRIFDWAFVDVMFARNRRLHPFIW